MQKQEQQKNTWEDRQIFKTRSKV